MTLTVYHDAKKQVCLSPIAGFLRTTFLLLSFGQYHMDYMGLAKQGVVQDAESVTHGFKFSPTLSSIPVSSHTYK